MGVLVISLQPLDQGHVSRFSLSCTSHLIIQAFIKVVYYCTIHMLSHIQLFCFNLKYFFLNYLFNINMIFLLKEV